MLYVRYLRKMLKKIAPIMVVILFACVEHTFYFKVSPNGSYKVKYNAHGDKNDLNDNDFSLPTDPEWFINSTMDVIEAESYEIYMIPVQFSLGKQTFQNADVKVREPHGNKRYLRFGDHVLEIHVSQWNGNPFLRVCLLRSF